MRGVHPGGVANADALRVEAQPAYVRKEVIGDCTLYLGDCAAIAPSLDRACRVVSDPPYGMDWNTDSTRFTGGQHKRGEGRADWGDIKGDAEPFDPAPWLEFKSTVLWGANHYFQRLPVGKTLVWLKKPPHLYGTFLSDCEVGWASGGHGVFAHFRQFPPPSRMAENDGVNVAHPTQKPLSLMRWCIEEFAAGPGPVLDPFMGSGTTGVAAVGLGRHFIGIERDPAHFAVACRRIAEAVAQPRLFDEPPPKPIQEALAL
jgi:site-specific DNA-methyltransferase (adenine-specific)